MKKDKVTKGKKLEPKSKHEKSGEDEKGQFVIVPGMGKKKSLKRYREGEERTA